MTLNSSSGIAKWRPTLVAAYPALRLQYAVRMDV